MRGFRKVGRVEHGFFYFDEDAEVDDTALITCSVDILGEQMRTGWWRARDVRDRYVSSSVHNDYLFVATALGEDCFK